jgi:hypothetical protein
VGAEEKNTKNYKMVELKTALRSETVRKETKSMIGTQGIERPYAPSQQGWKVSLEPQPNENPSSDRTYC